MCCVVCVVVFVLRVSLWVLGSFVYVEVCCTVCVECCFVWGVCVVWV